MEYKFLGMKFNLVNVIICVALGFLICAMIGCDCIDFKGLFNKKEGFIGGSSCSNNINPSSPLAPLIGATPSMDAAAVEKKGCNKAPMAASVEGESMFYLNEKNVNFNSDCCPKSVYSNSMGCACLSDSQWGYLNERGGNRTLPTEY